MALTPRAKVELLTVLENAIVTFWIELRARHLAASCRNSLFRNSRIHEFKYVYLQIAEAM